MKNFKDFTDKQLIDEIVKVKNTDAFGEFYERYAPIVYNKAITIVNNKETAEDLTHDIFIKIYFNLPKFKFGAKLSTWIYAITYNFCIDYLRKNKKLKEIPIEAIGNMSDTLVIDEDETDFVKEISQIKLMHLEEILNKIPHQDKIILLMKYQDELSIQDIMQVLNLKESAVKMRLKRAKEKVLMLYKAQYKNQ